MKISLVKYKISILDEDEPKPGRAVRPKKTLSFIKFVA
jgi:hypothetical protein